MCGELRHVTNIVRSQSKRRGIIKGLGDECGGLRVKYMTTRKGN